MSQIITKTPSMKGPQKFETVLTYDTANPYAIHAMFGRAPWMFARSLLREGLVRVAGDGDVTIASNDFMVGFTIGCWKTGIADLTMPREHIENFLYASYSLVPDGAESSFIDMDAEIKTLLGSS